MKYATALFSATRLVRRWRLALLGVFVWVPAGSAYGQSSSREARAADGGTLPAAFAETRSGASLTSGADTDLGGAGTAEASLLRDVQAAQQSFFRSFNDGIIRVPKLGYGQGTFTMAAPLGGFGAFAPLAIAERPGAAEVKVGRLYLDLSAATLSFLYTDNSQLTEAGREPEPTLALRLEGQLLYQLNEAMQLSMAGSVFWLPLTEEVTLSDPLAAYTGQFAPQLQTQFNYDLPFNYFDVRFLESFSAQSTGLGETGDAFQLLNQRDDARNFRDTQAQGPTDRRTPTSLAYRNNIGGNITSLLPTVTRVTLGYAHENIWQSGGRGQSSSSDIFSGELRSERENLRFKPYFNYSARHQANRFGYDTLTRGGVDGPVTDYLDLMGEVGYFLTGDESGEGYTWLVSLTHRPRERIRHQLSYGRFVTYPDRSLSASVSYTAGWQASPDILLEAAAQEVNFEPIDNPNNSFGGKQFRTEGRINYRMGRNITTQLGHAWTHAVDRRTAGRFDRHTFRFQIITEHTPKLQSTVILSHESRDSNLPLDSYEENVVAISLSRRF